MKPKVPAVRKANKKVKKDENESSKFWKPIIKTVDISRQSCEEGKTKIKKAVKKSNKADDRDYMPKNATTFILNGAPLRRVKSAEYQHDIGNAVKSLFTKLKNWLWGKNA